MKQPWAIHLRKKTLEERTGYIMVIMVIFNYCWTSNLVTFVDFWSCSSLVHTVGDEVPVSLHWALWFSEWRWRDPPLSWAELHLLEPEDGENHTISDTERDNVREKESWLGPEMPWRSVQVSSNICHLQGQILKLFFIISPSLCNSDNLCVFLSQLVLQVGMGLVWLVLFFIWRNSVLS